MTATDVKTALIKWSDILIEGWFDPMAQPLIKGLVNANACRIESAIDAFCDKDGNIALDDILDQYYKIIPATGYNIDARSIFGDNIFTRSLSIKVLERSDIDTLKNLINGSRKKVDGMGEAK